jgi:hypothetical protein
VLSSAQCGCHGLKRRHPYFPHPGTLTERLLATPQNSNRRGCPRADISDVSDPERSVCCKRRQNVHSTLLCKRIHQGLYNWELIRTQPKTLKLNRRGRYSGVLLKARRRSLRSSGARFAFLSKRCEALVSPKGVGATGPCPRDRRISGKHPSALHERRRFFPLALPGRAGRAFP